MKKIALFPGSFDPFTLGHEAIVKRALPLFDEIIIAIGYNSEKAGFFSVEKRIEWIEQVFAKESKISVASYEGLTVDFCKKTDANFILRGLRNSTDFQYEQTVAQMNKIMSGIETVLLLTDPELSALTSTVVRDIIRHNGDVSMFVPKEINLK